MNVPQSPAYSLISFDLDGTLVDSAGEIVEAANRALASVGIARRAPSEIVPLLGMGTRELMLRLLALCRSEQPTLVDEARQQRALAAMDEHYVVTTGTTAAPYAGCIDMLAAIKAAGVRMACVTNKELRHAQRLLEATGLSHCFDLLIGGDSLAERKPHASVLQHVARELEADPAASVHLGDSAIDVRAARNAGFGAWAVSFGYNAGVPIAASHPDRIFDALAEVTLAALPGRVR